MKGLEARIELAKVLASKGVNKVIVPDISSKAGAQKAIGLDMDALIKEKETFKSQILPTWDRSAV